MTKQDLAQLSEPDKFALYKYEYIWQKEVTAKKNTPKNPDLPGSCNKRHIIIIIMMMVIMI